MFIMCEFCIRDEEARRAEAIGSNGTAGPSLAGQTVNSFQAGFVGTDQSNMLALVYGQKWDRNDLTFSFPDQASDYGSYVTGENSTFTGLNSSQKNAAKAALGMLESYALLQFTEVTGNQGSAEIRLGESGLPGTAWAYYPDASAQSGDVWLDNNLYDDPRVGTYAYHTFMHELGHSIGLKHGHDTSGYGALDYAKNQMAYSVMTYNSHSTSSGSTYTNEFYGYSQTYMIYDIAAVQAIYGVNWSTNSGASIYKWSSSNGTMSINGANEAAPASNRVFSTIWDGGGRDLLDLSNYHQGTTGDMAPGQYLSFSSIQKAQVAAGVWADGNIYFALAPNGSRRKAMIEDLILGSGDDFVYGNKTRNVIEAKGGNDRIDGRGDHDVLYGNGGKDFLKGGPGRDTLDGGLGKDTLKGGSQADVFILNETSGKDIIKDFQAGLDRIDVPDPSLASLTTNPMGHLTVDFQGNWAVLRGLTYSVSLDVNDYVF